MKVAYSENIDRVVGTIREVGDSMQRSTSWSPILLAPVEILGVDTVHDFGPEPMTEAVLLRNSEGL